MRGEQTSHVSRRYGPSCHGTSPAGQPRPVHSDCGADRAFDGRSPDSRVLAFPNLPGPFSGPVVFSGSLAAHSCGGSHGFGAFWLHLTVFPFHPALLRGPETIDAHETRCMVQCQWTTELPNDLVQSLSANTCRFPNCTGRLNRRSLQRVGQRPKARLRTH